MRYDPGKMPGLYGKHQPNLRISVHNQIAQSEIEVGPFFVETVRGQGGNGLYLQNTWFDIYAPTETALVAIVSTF